jgi:hypothetical protein
MCIGWIAFIARPEGAVSHARLRHWVAGFQFSVFSSRNAVSNDVGGRSLCHHFRMDVVVAFTRGSPAVAHKH